MKTYTPVRGMIKAENDTGPYVDRADFEDVSARLATLQNRFGIVQLEYQNVSARLKATKLELEARESKLTDLGRAHMAFVAKMGRLRWWAALAFCCNVAIILGVFIFLFYR